MKNNTVNSKIKSVLQPKPTLPELLEMTFNHEDLPESVKVALWDACSDYREGSQTLTAAWFAHALELPIGSLAQSKPANNGEFKNNVDGED